MIRDFKDSNFNSFYSNGHFQTIWSALIGKKTLKKATNFFFKRERWITPDNDFIDIDWLNYQQNYYINKPLLVLFHGLEGSSDSQYSLAFAMIALERNWSFVVVNFRGCSGEINSAPRAYHAGDSDEIDWILKKLNSIASIKTIFCIGVSLGGNALLKWVGIHDKGNYSKLNKLKAVAVLSAPLDLMASGKKLDKGINRFIYSKYFLKTMIKKAKAKWAQYPGLFDLKAVIEAKTVKQFDDAFTAPVHKFMDVHDYWIKSSSIYLIKYITTPSLIINAQNDPIIPNLNVDKLFITRENIEYWNPSCGGHVGFPTKIKVEDFKNQFLSMPRLIVKWFENKL